MLADYENPKVHRKFVRFCREGGCLDYAARRYRRRLDQDPADERAKAALVEIREQAMAGLVPVLRKERRGPSGLSLALAGIAAGLLALAVGYVLRRMALF